MGSSYMPFEVFEQNGMSVVYALGNSKLVVTLDE
jgi:hypothetical protein